MADDRVEGYATALAAPLVPADTIAAARRVNEQMRECLEDFDPHRFTELNRSFHALLYMSRVTEPPWSTCAPRNIPEKHCACSSLRRDISSPAGLFCPAS